ncbi:hypothetical protein ACFE04_027533 [Oxalis oulophora]
MSASLSLWRLSCNCADWAPVEILSVSLSLSPIVFINYHMVLVQIPMCIERECCDLRRESEVICDVIYGFTCCLSAAHGHISGVKPFNILRRERFKTIVALTDHPWSISLRIGSVEALERWYPQQYWPTAFYMQSVALAKLDMHKDAADMLNEAALLEEKKQQCGK